MMISNVKGELAQLEAELRVPSIDFSFKTDPLETSKADFAIMGDRSEREILPVSLQIGVLVL
jgi:hypothetical protein